MRAHRLPTFVGVSVLAALLAACGSDRSSSAPSSDTSASTGGSVPSELRDVRYCEVIPSVTEGDTTTTYVYNTLGSNFCPPGRWSSLTEADVNEEYGSQSAELNGPRHWVMDSIAASGETTTGQTY